MLFRSTVKSAHRVLTLLGREISLPGVENIREISLRGMESSTAISQWERSGNNRRQTTPRRPPILKLFFRYAISIVGLLWFAAFLAR